MDTNHLPQALRSWVEQQQRALRQKDDVAPPENPLVLENDENHLTIRFVLGSDQNLLLLQEQRATTKCGATTSSGLSPRENQVLQWLSQGKTNKEIGLILELSARTVQKHLEHIYRKLGVENRTGAAAKAHEISSIGSKTEMERFLTTIETGYRDRPTSAYCVCVQLRR